MKIPSSPSWLALGLLFSGLDACRREPSPVPVAASPAPPVAGGPSAGATLAPWCRELLQLAFDAASAFPIEPHGKNRSRTQEQVVIACFQLGQPDLALAYAGRILDWRRGCAYADYAWEMARRGDAARSREYVALAEGVANDERQSATAQAWRRDLIQLKVGRALTALGDLEGAKTATADIDAASANAIDGAWSSTAADQIGVGTPEQAATVLAGIEQDFARFPLGQQNVALATLVKVHDVHFGDAALRGRCERLVGAWAKLLPSLRLQTLGAMVRTNVAHGRLDDGKALLAQMRTIFEGHAWRTEDRLPEAARLVELSVAVGDTERARADAERALAEWHEQRASVVNIYRARTLRPLAFAWHALGDAARFQELMALVIEEGMENPNSRPRCDDLVDTCVAMAVGGIAPSPGIRQRLQEIQRGLGNPW